MSSSIILHKRNSSSGAVPTVSSLHLGELGLNTADGKIFLKTTADAVKQFSDDSTRAYILNTSLSSINPIHGNNIVTGIFSTVNNGFENTITGAGSVINSGEQNQIYGDYGVIGGGTYNTISSAADFGGIFGGDNNNLNHPNSFIIGSNITSHASNYTYVENLSCIGELHCSNMEIGLSGELPTLFVNSSAVGIKTETPQTTLDINGSSIRITNAKTPASSSAAGVQGEMCWDSSYFYVCVATNTWKRFALNTW